MRSEFESWVNLRAICWLVICIALALPLASCSETETASTASNLELTLSMNTEWPFETTGILDIVEAGGYEDSDYPTWAVGSLLAVNGGGEVGISIGDGVVARAKINIDSGKAVKVWLDAPKTEYGYKTYPITKIQSQ